MPTEKAVEELFGRLGQELTKLGLHPVAVQRGTSWKLGARSLCRIDPKAAFLRVHVGARQELEAPTGLRGPYRQRGWLVIRPEDAAVGEAYVLHCVKKLIREG